MKIVKRIVLILFFLIFLVVTSGVIIAYVYQDRVKEYLVGEISKNLKAETGVSEIEFSVLRKFPMASLSFSQIWCKSTGEHMSFDTLFVADHLFLQFHFMDIFSNNYSITQVDLENARVNIEFNKYGKDNFHFWKEREVTDSSSEKAFSINLERMVFDNTHINYVDAKRKQDFAFQANSILASGSLMDSTGLLSLGFDAIGEKLIVGKTDYLTNKRVIGSVDLSFDSEIYEFMRGDVSIDGLQVSVDGYIDKQNVGSAERELSLKFLGSNLDIANALALLPENDLVNPYTIKGDVDLIISVKDDLNTRQAPVVTIDFKTGNASLTIDSLNLTFAHIELDGQYSSYYNEKIDGAPRRDKQFVEVYSFSSQIGFDKFGGNFKLWDFSNTQIDLELKGEFDLENLQDSHVPGLDSLLHIEGELAVEINTKGSLKAYTDHRRNYMKNVDLKGFIDLKLVNFQSSLTSLPVAFGNGRLVLSNNDVLLKGLIVRMEASYATLDGYFQNVIPFLLMEDEDIFIDAELKAEMIDLDQLLRKEDMTSRSDTMYQLDFPERIKFNLKTDIDRLVFRRFTADNISGTVKLKDQKLIAKNLEFEAMDGSISLNGLVDGSGEKVLVSCDAWIGNIDISNLFHTFENFGQDYITEHNIKGIGNADIQFVSVWNKDLTIIQDQIYTKADISIVKGELIDNKSLLALSDYMAVSELEHVKFSTLKNQIVIRNRNIHIPKMEIKSSALDITVSGDHTFDHDISYKFKIYLPELLSKKSKKAKKSNEEFGVIDDDGLGMWLFLTMSGTVKDPIIKYDKKSYVQKIGEDFKKEKQTLKAILNAEFGWFKKDTSIVNSNLKKNKNNKKEKFGDDYFIIEWDEDKDLGDEEDDDDDF